MTFIFVNTDNSDVTNKIYSGLAAGKHAAKAEQKIQKAVIRVLGKATGFTTTKSDGARGYTIRLKVTKVEVINNKTKSSVSGSVELYPPAATKTGIDGTEWIVPSMIGNATADGTDERAAVDGIESIVEDLVAKAIPPIRTDAAKRGIVPSP